MIFVQSHDMYIIESLSVNVQKTKKKYTQDPILNYECSMLRSWLKVMAYNWALGNNRVMHVSSKSKVSWSVQSYTSDKF